MRRAQIGRMPAVDALADRVRWLKALSGDDLDVTSGHNCELSDIAWPAT